MGDERRQIDPPLATIVISRRIRSLPPGQSVVTIRWSASPAIDRLVGRDELAGIHAQARQHASGPHRTQRRLECLLAAERLDRDVDAAAIGEPFQLLDDVAGVRVERYRAPNRRAIARRSAIGSTPTIRDAPRSRAPRVAHSPIGPCAKTATASPTLTPPLSAPEMPVDAMSGSISTCSSVSPSGMTARLARASGRAGTRPRRR